MEELLTDDEWNKISDDLHDARKTDDSFGWEKARDEADGKYKHGGHGNHGGGSGKLSKQDKAAAREARRLEKKARKLERGGPSFFRIIARILIVIVLILAAGVGTLFYLRYKGGKDLQNASVQEDSGIPDGVDAQEQDDGSIMYKGKKYWYNKNLVTVLCMGIDKSASESSDQSIGENGQADAIFLTLIDTATGKMSIINISRESMADVELYNTAGEYAGVENMQICLAYAYGDGHESSCLNVARSVSRLFNGIPINAYFAMDYTGVPTLNDDVGGVSVQVLEDLSAKDPALTYGSWVTLKGEQSVTYIRSRDTALLESNNTRMDRQKQYLTGFLQNAFSGIKSNPTLIPTLYSDATDYMVTDISLADLTYLASQVVQHGYATPEMSSVPGTVVQGDVYAEYQVDKAALFDLIIKNFYVQTKN